MACLSLMAHAGIPAWFPLYCSVSACVSAGTGRDGLFFSLSLSLSLLQRCCFPVGKNACECVFPCTDRGGAPPRFPLRLSRCWLNGFSASPAVMRFSVQGGFLSERRTVHGDGLSASEAAPFPFREIRFSILSDKVKRKDRHPVGFLKSGKYRRNFLKGALKTRREFVEQAPDRNVLLLS